MLFPYPLEMLYSIGILVIVWLVLLSRENRMLFPEAVYLQDLPEQKQKRAYVRRKVEPSDPAPANTADAVQKFVRSEPFAEPPVIGHFNPRPLTPSRAVTMQTQTTPYNLRSSRKLPHSSLPDYGLKNRQVPTRQVIFAEAVEDEGM
ncbi:unnamed protein product [Bursaphelenchus xylophilus]|uniref:(pine wood nematode) hypothetical protein n=1 Tax=Bursaphelenchus xylophilus TaxID=6326 RepID=A0A1I7SN79_BURXY|nr:unnamed protein product [Bursaphelenchus xylophilus]CAG9122462.1 unnamed protein product [Bursaphelenchus xylophilus]